MGVNYVSVSLKGVDVIRALVGFDHIPDLIEDDWTIEFVDNIDGDIVFAFHSPKEVPL